MSLKFVKPVNEQTFDINKYNCGSLQKNDFGIHLLFAYPKYNGNKLLIKTDWIKMNGPYDGIPNYNGTFFTDDKSRSFLKLTLDGAQSDLNGLEYILNQIDSYHLNNKNAILQDYKNYKEYFPMITKKTVNHHLLDSDDEEEGDHVTYKYCTLKLNTDWQNGKIKTSVFTNKNGNISRIPSDKLQKIEPYLKKGKTLRFIIMLDKIWCSINGPGWGAKLKIMQVEVKDDAYNSYEDMFYDYQFTKGFTSTNDVKVVDDDDDDEEMAWDDQFDDELEIEDKDWTDMKSMLSF